MFYNIDMFFSFLSSSSFSIKVVLSWSMVLIKKRGAARSLEQASGSVAKARRRLYGLVLPTNTKHGAAAEVVMAT